jgi:hypothetical protein
MPINRSGMLSVNAQTKPALAKISPTLHLKHGAAENILASFTETLLS